MSSSSPARYRRKSSYFCKLAQKDEMLDEESFKENNDYTKVVAAEGSAVSKSEIDKEKVVMSHIFQMTKEMTDWKNSYRHTKCKLQDMEKHRKDINIVGWVQCKTSLYKEDLDFLSARPNYEELISTLRSLTEMVEISKQKITQINKQVRDGVDSELNTVMSAKRILCQHLLDSNENTCTSSWPRFEDSGNCSMEIG